MWYMYIVERCIILYIICVSFILHIYYIESVVYYIIMLTCLYVMLCKLYIYALSRNGIIWRHCVLIVLLYGVCRYSVYIGVVGANECLLYNVCEICVKCVAWVCYTTYSIS
jgi:hypothetical protein